MANLLGQNIGTNYRGILNIGSTINTSLSATPSVITDGMGNNSTLSLGTNQVVITNGSLTISNGNLTTAGRYTSTGGYSNTSGIAISALESSSTFGAAVGNAIFRPISISYTINNSGAQTGTATGIFLNATETTLNGMTHNLMDLQIGGTSYFKVKNNKNIDIFSNTQLNWITYGAYIYHDASNFQMSTGGSILFTPSSNLVKIGGTTNLFPALKRNGANIEFRLADDSGYANVIVGQLTLNSTLTSSRLEMNGDYLGINSVATITGGGYNGIINIGPWSGADMRINMSASTNMTSLINGTGSPEGVVTARVGSIYMRKDGGAGTSFYVKESGTGNTGWVAK